MDSERPIEKLLRACAKKRRDEAGAPFELHPADRKVLQAEIERKFAKPKRSASFPQSLLVLVPRLVWGTAILAALAIIAFMLVPTPNKPDPDAFLAQNAPMPAEPQRHELSPTQVPALTEQLGTRPPSSDLKDLADKSVLEKSARSETSRSLSLFLDAPVSPPVPAPVAELKQQKIRRATDPVHDSRTVRNARPVLCRGEGGGFQWIS